MHLIPDPAGRRLRRIAGRARANRDKVAPPPAARVSAPALKMAEACLLSGSAAVAERRCSGRIAMNDEVIVRRLGGFNFEVALRDLSPGGCRVEMLEPSEVGDPAVARLPKLEPLGAQVCWAEGTTTGLKFHATIHPAVFDHLLSRMNPERVAAE